MPHTSVFPDQAMPPPMSLKDQIVEARKITTMAFATHIAKQHLMASQAGSLASTQAPFPSPLVTSVLSKHSSPPPPTSPLPPVNSPILHALQDWHTWMEWKHAIYSDRNLGHPVLAVVTPLDLHEAAQAASLTPVPPPSLCPPFPSSLLPAPPLLQMPPCGKKQKPHKPLA